MTEDYKPFKCQNLYCESYLQHPICHNHAHVYCEKYKNEKAINTYLDNFRASQGFPVAEPNNTDISREVEDE